MTYKSILQVILAYSQRTNIVPYVTIFFSDRDIEANIIKVDSEFVYLKRGNVTSSESYFISISSINGIKINNSPNLIEEIEDMIGGLIAFT